jgi:hypothetical protein
LSSTALLLALLDEAFDRRAWHGPTLLGSIKGIRAEAAAWRPGSGRHNIWELTVHAAYWKYAVRRRLLGDKRGSFPLKGSNWFTRPGPALHSGDLEGAWSADVRLLTGEHARLRAAVEQLSSRALMTAVGARGPVRAFLVRGVAAHDLYHAGQIQLIKRLMAA